MGRRGGSRELLKKRASTPLSWHATQAVTFYDWSLLLRAASSSLALSRSLSFTLSLSSSLPPRARLSTSSLSFFGPRELSRRVSPPPRRWNRIAFFLLQWRRRHSKTRTRRYTREEKREEPYRTRSHSAALARSFAIPRASPTGIPSLVTLLYCSPLRREILLLYRATPRLQIVIVIEDQWKRNHEIRSRKVPYR